ncbi:sugar O-acyltransferase (sialic acid O-acetyltransferase NeuD family) [Clostridium punense]|uniref:Sugar O-acyltransferase (Sialic acid O-acetyltransferase NeuD family) n=1 Tax=Clostridium punense TaxID=1054297 RepID=A0ABS4K216_9CLOT|nr:MULTISPECIES: acetyltransferase [Clostridium]EQB87118.1 hypothetical protein M918_10780 [Clostridium sp. BL8]MBP2021817.1 sugar O-acyltransferase (sialic acid O-acetyltransferase NeuD family) [Clostridium punense]
MENIILVGGGGHCKSVIDSIIDSKRFNVVGIIDLKRNIGLFINSVQVVGQDEDYEKFFLEGVKYAFITIGSTTSTTERERVYKDLKSVGFQLPIIVDPSAIVSKNVEIGEGTFVGKGAIINTNSVIGQNCIINTGTIIEHDCVIQDYCHVAPGSTLSGGVKVGRSTLIGTNSTVIQGVQIGSNTIVGAGSVVVKDIKQNCIAYGNPCKEVR